MRLAEMIQHLQALHTELGDVEVLVTDGHQAQCYRGAYEIREWQEDNGVITVDIGIGGCLEY